MKALRGAVLVVGVTVFAFGYSPGVMAGFAEGFAAGAVGSDGNPSHANPKIMIFGGPGHDVYLGCLSCSEYASDSVLNRYGTFGSAYSGTSIHNRYGQYGSLYSGYSPCNPYATTPPVVVDENGTFHGRLTLNQYHHQAIRDTRTVAWLRSVCA